MSRVVGINLDVVCLLEDRDQAEIEPFRPMRRARQRGTKIPSGQTFSNPSQRGV